MADQIFSRRSVLLRGGLAGFTLPTLLQFSAQAKPPTRKPSVRELGATPTTTSRARSCIIIYLWGGIAHQESWDPKPNAKVDLRGEFNPISTATTGVQFCEHIPLMAQHSEKLAIVRSLHHKVGGHGGALYTSITGQPAPLGKARDPKHWP